MVSRKLIRKATSFSHAGVIAIATGFGGVVLMFWETLSLPGDGALIGIATAASPVTFAGASERRAPAEP